MTSSVQGLDAFLRRLIAIQRAPAKINQRWADNTVTEMRKRVRKRTGRTARSFRHTRVTNTGSTIIGSQVANVLDAGAREHQEFPTGGRQALKFKGKRGRTMFSPKVTHPRQPARPFKKRAMNEGLRQAKMGQTVVDEWNGAA